MEGEKEFSIELAVPGMSRKDIRINLENDVLTVSSEQKEDKEGKKQNFVRREFRYNSFKRSFQLPETVDQESINASHDAGILTIHLPKKKEVVENVVRTIEIK
jgi:HSP20 family protein